MEPERIALSQRERDRLKVLHEVEQKHVTQVEAGRRLDVTDRHIRRLLVRLHQHGDSALGPAIARIFRHTSSDWSFLTIQTLIECGPSP